jgi:hypothetical protein
MKEFAMQNSATMAAGLFCVQGLAADPEAVVVEIPFEADGDACLQGVLRFAQNDRVKKLGRVVRVQFSGRLS